MIRVLLATALFVAVTPALHAQERVREVTGVVTDSVGAPLGRAAVFIPDTKLATATDSSGHYHLRNVPATPFSIRVQASGFRPKQVDGLMVRESAIVADFVLYPFIEEPSPRPVASSRLPR